MAADLAPLLRQISTLAPRFGRAQSDLEAMVSRGQAGDFKGVMQNARLVLEALLRSIVSEELKQTPGKAMLDELVTKFRQQANAGIVPTNVLAHMGTVQAWGNLSAHDHAGSLADRGVTVGPDEVFASLNSFVAILTWYDKRKAPAPEEAATTGVQRGGSPIPMIAGAGALVALVGGVAGWALMGSKPSSSSPSPEAFAALDAVYATRDEPPPPAACRRSEDASTLARSATLPDQLALISNPSPEAAYLLARALPVEKELPTLAIALQCPGFAAAMHLAGKRALVRSDLKEARDAFQSAAKAAPTWRENRSRLAGVLLQLGDQNGAERELEELLRGSPDYAPAFLVRASLRDAQNRHEDAARDLCKAKALGNTQAAKLAAQANIECPP